MAGHLLGSTFTSEVRDENVTGRVKFGRGRRLDEGLTPGDPRRAVQHW
jgi:hypothetical protein